MKKASILAVILTLFSCSKNAYENLRFEYPRSSRITHELNVDLVIHKDVNSTLQAIDYSLNKNFFNKYGVKINVNLINMDIGEIKDDDLNKTYIPKRTKNITIYVLPNEKVFISGYYVDGYSYIISWFAVVSETEASGKTTAHELCHALGLEHETSDSNNLMYPYAVKGSKNEISQKQLDIIIKSIERINKQNNQISKKDEIKFKNIKI